MNDYLYGTRLYVNFSHLEHNIKVIRGVLNNCQTIAMVKANAYGHGDVAMSLKMEELGINYFGVADFDEGIKLRVAGIKSDIMVMNPGSNNIETVIEYNLEPVIYNRNTLSALKNVIIKNNSKYSKNPISIHLKINTGMNRWGFNFSEITYVIKTLQQIKGVRIKSIYSHLASAKNMQDDNFTNNQIKKLTDYTLKFKNTFKYTIATHIYNSFGLIRFFKHHNAFDYSRIGLALYGGIKDANFKPVSELKCLVSQIRIINKGESVGYNRSFIAKNKIKIGLIPFGYADGLQRSWGNGMLKFKYKNQLIPTVGEISMDSCIVDLTDIKNISVSDEICYFGVDRPIWKLAEELNTIPHEIMSTLSRRIKRIYQ